LGTLDYDWLVIRTDKNGNLIWTKVLRRNGFDHASFIEQSLDGGFILGGNSLCKLSANGSSVWSKKYSSLAGSGSSQTAFVENADSSIVFTGYYSDTIVGECALLFKANSLGLLVWWKAFNFGIPMSGVDLKKTADGGYIIAAENDGINACLIKTDSVGDTLWTNNYSGISIVNSVSNVNITTDSGYVLTGYLWNSNSQMQEIFFIKTDKYGSSGCFENKQPILIATPGVQELAISYVGGSASPVNTSFEIHITSGIDVNNYCLSDNAINQTIQDDEVFLSPNPFNNGLKLNFHRQQSEKALLLIFNLAGEEITEKQILLENQSLDLSFLPPGIYILSVITGKKVYTRKIVKI
ncbi:MAG: T9SS type A sorting domain-containing protein, partial [Bacteroidetes bacterium]|nr:T9SS type A sorting domain-containing protein [Bacteroidota bacterium]